MTNVNKAKDDSHVVANIKSETRNTTMIVKLNDKNRNHRKVKK